MTGDFFMSFKFEKLTIWQEAMDLGEVINRVAGKFHEKEVYNLNSQIRRAADSIALNISEGSIGQTVPEMKRFIGYAIRSNAEVVTCLYKARNRGYISDEEFDLIYEKCFILMNKMSAFRKSVR